MRPKDPTLRAVTELRCGKCDRLLPVSEFERYPTGTYRHVCNQCRWVCYIKPWLERRKAKQKRRKAKQKSRYGCR